MAVCNGFMILVLRLAMLSGEHEKRLRVDRWRIATR
jgi:hypothetical protein